jgi:urease accessory protein
MLDNPKMQRVRGEAHVSLGRSGLRDLRQAGSAKAILPRVDGDVPEVVFLNTAGGVTSGDRLDFRLDVGPGARATGATQTAERAYRATGGPGRIATRLSVGKGGRLDWLPQEVILFEDSHLERETTVDLTGDATFLGVESLVLGRAAHGETIARARLDDLRTIRRDGVPVVIEHLTLTPDTFVDAMALGDARALSTLVFVEQGAQDAGAALNRCNAASSGVRLETSGWDGRLIVRLMSPDPAALRRVLISAIVALRGAEIPRVWQSDE